MPVNINFHTMLLDWQFGIVRQEANKPALAKVESCGFVFPFSRTSKGSKGVDIIQPDPLLIIHGSTRRRKNISFFKRTHLIQGIW
jgi:hypothetical protein